MELWANRKNSAISYGKACLDSTVTHPSQIGEQCSNTMHRWEQTGLTQSVP